MRKDVATLWSLVEPTVKGTGFDLIELEWTRDAGGWVLRVYIDRPWVQGPTLPGATEVEDPLFVDLASVGHEDCEQVSRQLSAALDVEDAIPHAYRLEVSSPGLDRPLRREQDFMRFAGREAKIRTADLVEGRRNFSGILRGVTNGAVDIECDGHQYRIPVSQVSRANLIPDWTVEFRRAERSAS